MRKLIESAVLWMYAIFYGVIIVFQVIKTVFTKGYGKTFKTVKREQPECLRDPDLGTHGFLHLEDVRIHYVAKGPEDKPLMLFVHGFPEFWYSWRSQLQEFSNDYRCVAIDMRGYGESDKPSGISPYAMKYLMKDIQQVIEALGYKTCHLVAHDWGGAVAWSFARFFPDYVDKLIVMNCPASPVFQKVLKTEKKQFRMSWYMFFFQLPFLPELLIGLGDFHSLDTMFIPKKPSSDTDKENLTEPTPELKKSIEAYKYTFSQPGALTGPINYYRAAFRRERVRYDMKYSMPTLLIWGMDDMALCDKIPTLTEQEAPSIVVKRIDKCGHFVQMDAPQKVNEIMREWLSSPSKD